MIYNVIPLHRKTLVHSDLSEVRELDVARLNTVGLFPEYDNFCNGDVVLYKDSKTLLLVISKHPTKPKYEIYRETRTFRFLRDRKLFREKMKSYEEHNL